MPTIFETKRRKNAGHFHDARGDMAVTHIAKGSGRGRALLITWGQNVSEESVKDFGPDAQFVREFGGKYLERVVSHGL